jgi:chromosomal replication initiator protein
VGVTHLLNALANEMIAAGGGKRPVACVNAQQFIDELIVALQEGTIERWRARYRLVDALLIDDVQLCATGERTQEELFHVFNSLYSAGKQVVLGADRAPRLIERLEDRLRSRFEGGLVVEIQPPDHSLREKLYARMFAAAGQHADRVLVDFLSARAVANVAELAATVDRLVKAAGVVGVPLNASFARKELEGGGFAPAPARVIDGREADSFFLDEEKVVWDWPDVAGRAIEDLR